MRPRAGAGAYVAAASDAATAAAADLSACRELAERLQMLEAEERSLRAHVLLARRR